MTASQRTRRLLVGGELRAGRVEFAGETITGVELTDDHFRWR